MESSNIHVHNCNISNGDDAVRACEAPSFLPLPPPLASAAARTVAMFSNLKVPGHGFV